jgi:FtsP/CotA-like multicopper oxidase with cupredoxin domain/HSP20 family molecular chaperone IbpA
MAITALSWGLDTGWAVTPMPNPGGIPDYYATPNWANSPLLRKFVDTLPGLGAGNVNNLGQYIPVAIPDTTTYPGSDYYEIEVGQYAKQMHSDMPPTRLRGYRQTNTADPTVSQFQYLGPLIISTKDRPVRVKFTNSLPTGAGGDLFVPVDTSVMGSGEFEINYDPETKAVIPTTTGMFKQNRATLHLHGGHSPWISDGTPHQWITPAGEATSYPKGVSVVNVPDMWFDAAGNAIAICAGQTTCAVPGATNNPGPGSQTFFWSNQQSSRMMFYHDHSWGITRLNVYAGEAAGYLITDQAEQNLLSAGLIPADQIPLVIQDKTFVSEATITATDPTWNWGSAPGSAVTGDLWWPHVYMPAQNPYNPNLSGINDFGRWHYGPWFYPPTPTCGSSPDAVKPYCIDFGPVPNPLYDPACNPAVTGFCQPPEMPGTPNPSWGAEAFLDTPVINGTAYPVLTVQPKSYRFRILNAAHDRFANLQLYIAADKNSPTTAGATGAVLCDGTAVVPFADCTEVKMVPAAATVGFPETWPTDGREGGVPDPATAGPSFIQIGTEGGFLPQPVVLPNQPVQWNMDPTMFNVGNVLQQADGGGTLFVGPAERADVIVDFSAFAGKTLILYNDAPTAFPALDPHYDYYTGAPDRTDIGGSPAVLPGFGPNVRTIMQIRVAAAAPAPVFDLAALQAAFVSTSTSTGVFAQSQSPVIVGQTAYNSTYNTTFPAIAPNWGISTIFANSLSFRQPDGTLVSNFPMLPKAIHDEMGGTFDDYGRMSAKLGLEVPFVNAAIANFILQNYVDPPTELVKPGEYQIWKITHNGVDTHPIHFHLFEVQLINRVGWDGFIRMPDPNELGWKDTVRISPLEDTIVALRPAPAVVPFKLPNSIRPLNPMAPLGSMMGFSQIDITDGGNLVPPAMNEMTNFGSEFVWHCHILSHEENDMMRSISLVLPPDAPSNLLAVLSGSGVNLTWTDNSLNETGFTVQRAQDAGFTSGLTTFAVGRDVTAFTDTSAAGSNTTYYYRVLASNTVGSTITSYPQVTADSAFSNTATVAPAAPVPAAPTNFTATITSATQVRLTWTDASNNETSFRVFRSVNGGAYSQIGQTTRTAAQSLATGGTVTVVHNSSPTAPLAPGNIYTYYATAVNANGSSPSNTATVNFSIPAAPTNLAGSAVGITGSTINDLVTLTWTDNAVNEGFFQIQRDTNAGFTAPTTFNVQQNVTTFSQNVSRTLDYYYRIRAGNPLGNSALRSMQHEMDVLFDRFLGVDVPSERRTLWMPSVESYTKEGQLVFKAELPGIDVKDLDVSIADRELVIKGARKAEKAAKEEDYTFREIDYGSFERRFVLPEGVKTDELKAKFTNGILEITMPAPTITKARSRSRLRRKRKS